MPIDHSQFAQLLVEARDVSVRVHALFNELEKVSTLLLGHVQAAEAEKAAQAGKIQERKAAKKVKKGKNGKAVSAG